MGFFKTLQMLLIHKTYELLQYILQGKVEGKKRPGETNFVTEELEKVLEISTVNWRVKNEIACRCTG